MKDGEAGVVRMPWYHHVQPGLAAGGLGRGGHAMTTPGVTRWCQALPQLEQIILSKSC